MTTKVEQEEQQPPSHTVFINYHKEDGSSAQKLNSDLKAANLNPWIDSENLLPGQNKKIETEKAIRESDYFIALLSKISVAQERGDVIRQIRIALDVFEEVRESAIFFIPSRLDDCEIPFHELGEIQSVDMFPNWEEGLERVLEAMKVDHNLIKSVIAHQRINSPFTSVDLSHNEVQTQTFKGEKQFFVGRQNYVNHIIKDRLRNPGSKVSIVGPGGSGKSQLAFKAMHEYVKDRIFDIVIPVYFDEGLLPFDRFLLQIAEFMGIRADDFELNNTMEQRKDKIRSLLSNKKHPLLYLDNFETVSLILNQKTGSETRESIQNANQITDFLNNIVPSENTSILVSSREKRNNLADEYPIDLEGLNPEDSMKLFNNFVRPVFKDQKGETRDQIKEILKKTGGHPLSIEIIAKNLRGLHELEGISNNLGLAEDPTQADKRFQTLRACFDYTIKRLDNKLQELIPKLTLFKSPFPISAAVDIFGISENEILDLYDRSLLKLVNLDELYGNIQDPTYWLYNFYLPVRGYVDDMMEQNGPSLHSLETEYGQKFSNYYYNLILDTYNSIGKENHRSALARFNIIYQGKENDFDRSIELTTNKILSAYISEDFGRILSTLGALSKAIQYFTNSIKFYERTDNNERLKEVYKDMGIALMEQGRLDAALDYHKKALEIDEDLNYRVGMGNDYTNIGNVLMNMGNNPQALDYHNKALAIHEELNDGVGLARDYTNIGIVLRRIGNYPQALDSLNKALEIDKELNDRVGMGKDYTNIGNVLLNMGNNQEALDHHKKALAIHEDLNDRIGMGADYSNIGLVLSDMGNYPQALDYHNKAFAIRLS